MIDTKFSFWATFISHHERRKWTRVAINSVPGVCHAGQEEAQAKSQKDSGLCMPSRTLTEHSIGPVAKTRTHMIDACDVTVPFDDEKAF